MSAPRQRLAELAAAWSLPESRIPQLNALLELLASDPAAPTTITDPAQAVELDSMTAQERRVVHLYLRERPEVETHSEGDDPFRRIVITPVRLTGGRG